MNDEIIFHNLTKFYGQTRGIENISLSIKKGSIFGYLGPNGSGKSTSIRCLLGIIKPTSGNVTVFGQKILNWQQKSSLMLKDRIGYLPGEFNLYRHLTVKQTLDYFSSLKKSPSTLRESLVADLELDERKKNTHLSKGNKQKVGIVQALMNDPDLLILDEPTTGLDPLMQERLYHILKDFKKRGKTIFFSSHNLAEVQKICDEVAIIKDGHLVSHDQIEQLSQKVHRKVIISVKQPLSQDSFMNAPYISKWNILENANYRTSDLLKYELWIDSLYNNLFELLPMLKANHISDIMIPEANLEDYFMKYYNTVEKEE